MHLFRTYLLFLLFWNVLSLALHDLALAVQVDPSASPKRMKSVITEPSRESVSPDCSSKMFEVNSVPGFKASWNFIDLNSITVYKCFRDSEKKATWSEPKSTHYIFPQIALAIGILTSNRREGGHQLWRGSRWVPLLGAIARKNWPECYTVLRCTFLYIDNTQIGLCYLGSMLV